MNGKLPISEVFHSIQGEGVTMGVPSVFIRLSGCNLMCGGQGTQHDKQLHNGATWRCDTIEVWMKGTMTPFEDVLTDKMVTHLRYGAHLIFTGGEPMLHQNKIVDFLGFVYDKYMIAPFVEIETNGTIEPINEILPVVDQWNVSPKLSNSGNDKAVRFVKPALKFYNTLETQFKFVISRKEDFEEIMNDFYFIDTDKIVLMPSGEDQELLNQSRQDVVELCVENCLNYSDRLHIVIWNQKTGV